MASQVSINGFLMKITALKGIKKAVMPKAYTYFRQITPIKTGNARNHTDLNGDNIEANYPYAYVLDQGRFMSSRGMRGSEQAPDGMTKPTTKYIKTLVEQYVSKIKAKR